MIELRPSPLASVSPGYPALLQPGYYVKFSDSWPATLGHVTYQDSGNITRGKFFQVQFTNQVNYDLAFKIPANDYHDVDFSNTVSAINENLYPNNPKTLYETMIGFKEANMLALFYVPVGEPVSRLEQPSMIPPVALPFSATLRYLGAKTHRDSSYNDKRIYFYSVFQMETLIMRLFVDNGVDFDKVAVGLVVNKCYLNQIASPTQDQLNRSKLIPYYTDIRW